MTTRPSALAAAAAAGVAVGSHSRAMAPKKRGAEQVKSAIRLMTRVAIESVWSI